MLHTALATGAALVSLAFGLSTFERWLASHRRHELAWSIALAMFAVASFALAAGAALGWGPLTFRVFYLFGAVANVPVLALGTVYLLAGRRRGDAWAIVVGLFVAFAAGVVAVAPFTGALPRDELARGSEVFGALPRILAAAASGGGATVVVAGALWSAARARSRGQGRLAGGNALIALGTSVTGASGLLNSVLDEMDGFAVTLLVGISLLFAGFLVATAGPPRPPAAAALLPGPLEADGPRLPAVADQPLGADEVPVHGRRRALGPPLSGHEEELDQGGREDGRQQDGEHDGGPASHGASSVTASPARSRSSSAADRWSNASDSRP
ncbi:MAG TPA: hypothetical protein VM264_06285 [Acidimicrobiales bacterium]|nr:hypothetical protein [Acidimicrobiales bacterium]